MRAAAVLDFYEFDVRSMMQLGQQKHQTEILQSKDTSESYRNTKT